MSIFTGNFRRKFGNNEANRRVLSMILFVGCGISRNTYVLHNQRPVVFMSLMEVVMEYVCV